MVVDLACRLVNSGLTLYMMMILLRWMAPWLELNINSARLSWIPKLTDPLIQRVRRILPPMGPMDFGPIGALFIVWLLRVILVSVLLNSTQSPVGG